MQGMECHSGAVRWSQRDVVRCLWRWCGVWCCADVWRVLWCVVEWDGVQRQRLGVVWPPGMDVSTLP